MHASVTALLVALALLSLTSRTTLAQNPNFPQLTPEQQAARNAAIAKIRAASEADRQQMMSLLGLKDPGPLPPADTDPKRPAYVTQRQAGPTNNWYDSVGNTFVRSQWGNWSNYDESTAGGTASPDPLVLKDGSRVTDATTWWTRRRPEILNDFQTQIYGKIPPNTPKVTFEVMSVDSTTFAGKAVIKKVVGHIDNSRYPAAKPSIDITMYLPAKTSGRIPIIVTAGGFFAPPNQLPAAVAQVIALGWAAASVNTNNIQADNGAGLSEGIIGLMNRGQPRKPDDWGVLAAWSWGLSRALDYFGTDPAIDASRTAVQGHSRWGKTALLAGALDQRWAIVWPSCSGSMGSSLEKRSWGETIDNVAGTGEYHWMAGNFLKYAGHWNDMPTDAHQLIALVAPRPIFNTGGTKDQWSDPHGEFLASLGADPVYRLLGKKGLGTTEMPAPDVSLISGENAFRNHEGGHTDAPDWPVFLEFAKRYFDAPKVAYLNESLPFDARVDDLVGAHDARGEGLADEGRRAGDRAARHSRVQLVERGTARRRALGTRDRVSAGHRLRRHVGRQSDLPHGHRHLGRVPREVSRVSPPESSPAVSGPHHLVAEHQSLPRSAMGPRAGDVRRRSVPHRPTRRAVHSRPAGRRSEVLQDHRDGEALRRAQRPRARSVMASTPS